MPIMLKQISNLSCYEEFEIQCTLLGISKVDVLKKFGHRIDVYYVFISNDGIFNWFDLEGNHVEDPGILEEIDEEYIPGNITKCVIPNSVTNIGDGAFSYCKALKEITIPNTITSINACAFHDCESLTSITIPNSVISIDRNAFSFCDSLKEIIVPDSVTSISWNAFSFCKSLKKVIFKGRTLKEVKKMKNFPFGIKNENVFKFS